MKVIVVDSRSIYQVQLEENSDDIALLTRYLSRALPVLRRECSLIEQEREEERISICVRFKGQRPSGYTYYQKHTFYARKYSDDLYSIDCYKGLSSDVAGGGAVPGWIPGDYIIDIADWWATALPVIEQIATVTGALTGVAAMVSAPFVFIKWVRSKLNKRKRSMKTELEWVSLILAKSEWNVSQLSQELSMAKGDVKRLLNGFGYKWDPKKMLYVASRTTEKLREIG